MFSIFGGEELWSVNNTSIYESSELKNLKKKVFKNINCFGEILSNWPNDLLGTNVYKTLESYW